MTNSWFTPWDGMDSNAYSWIFTRIQPRNSLERFILEDMMRRCREARHQEVSVDELVNYLYADDELIKEELKSLMRSYDIPEEYLGRVEAMIRDYIRSEVEKRGLPAEDWLINPLYKLFVHIAYVMLYV
jgi:hypothetical protein